jgi:hypothetical protein
MIEILLDRDEGTMSRRHALAVSIACGRGRREATRDLLGWRLRRAAAALVRECVYAAGEVAAVRRPLAGA